MRCLRLLLLFQLSLLLLITVSSQAGSAQQGGGQDETMLAARRPGDVVRLTIVRFDDLRTLEIRLGVHMDVLFRIFMPPQPTDEQRQIYQGWRTSA